jgi:L-fucono-1,5-lactonase
MNTMAHECIDAHHHLWNYRPKDYPWMGEGMEVLRHDYLPANLAEVTRSAGITGTVVVQARQTTEETEWLSGLAAGSELIRGVVGWAPLVDPNVAADLERLADLPKVKGVRHVLHDELDPYYMCRDDFHRGMSLLRQYGLRYDLLIFAGHLPQTIEFVDRHPSQIFILDHIAKPRIRESVLSPWRENLKELALRRNVYCKISGMVTEALWSSWKEEELKPYLDAAIEAFTPQRTMFGSDWPVLTLAAGYGQWAQIVRNHIQEFSPDEQRRILAGTAIEAYGL